MDISVLLDRKGATKGSLIPESVLALLNLGTLETVNLIEWTAINQGKLIQNTFPEMGLSELVAPILVALEQMDKPSAMKSVRLVGQYLYANGLEKGQLTELYSQLSIHKSDMIRSYACYVIALQEERSIFWRLEEARVLIADNNFGVREIIWMALRPEIVKQLDEVLIYLESWTGDRDERIRRFITEITRPKGVWTLTITELRDNPEKALPLLEALKSDSSLYVQNSVANWLNDASKSQPDFVRSTCLRWAGESSDKSTQYIVKRAMRTLNK